MGGYRILSSDEWCDNLREQGGGKAVFWRKRKTFKAIEHGEYIYFMSRKRAFQSRCIVGRGILKESISTNPVEAWDRFGKQLGSSHKEAFINTIKKLYGTEDLMIGCLVLDKVGFLDEPISIHDFGIVYQNGTVSGKTLSEEECCRINDTFRKDE